MPHDAETPGIGDSLVSDALSEDFRRMRENRLRQDQAITPDILVQWLSFMSRVSYTAPPLRTDDPYRRALI